MPRVGFKPTIPVFEWAKTVHALDRVATVISQDACTHTDIYHKPISPYRTRKLDSKLNDTRDLN
jgi:hypothetical protein